MNRLLTPSETFRGCHVPKLKAHYTLEERIVAYIDGYLWVTRGAYADDSYSLTDEDDFNEFREGLKELLQEK